MLRSMYSAIAGMKSEQNKLDVVANNIANVSTTSFKASKVNFEDTLYQTTSNATAATTNLGGTNSKSVGLGSKVSSINKLMTNGNALTTGRTLDVDIDGDGYFLTTKGAVTGSIGINNSNNTLSGTNTGVADTYYTRNGNFSLDAAGNLVTSDGYRVMGYYAAGTAYNSTTQTIGNTGAYSPDSSSQNYASSALQPLAIPDTITPSGGSAQRVSAISIGTDGVITVTTPTGKYAIGQIAMAAFKNPEGLNDVGGSYQQQSANSGDAIVRSVALKPTSDNSASFGNMKSGYLEASNVDLTEQFTDMISATRAFQAASKMISNGDEILQTITGLVR